ncbi:DUF2249 domain-containing protein [Cerasicoccus frondis]|uniref:DUF2249 domain-containing protein n=1 Tax=Cerasicoccus frondis TaxID=490090 RepID=UPI00285261AF|nr:DUF2249 domain-containing protein [Cerasicoccus frondis]
MEQISMALDLRDMDTLLASAAIGERVASVAENGSFWMIHDHDPVELYELLDDLGFSMQAYFYDLGEYRIFAGRH